MKQVEFLKMKSIIIINHCWLYICLILMAVKSRLENEVGLSISFEFYTMPFFQLDN